MGCHSNLGWFRFGVLSMLLSNLALVAFIATKIWSIQPHAEKFYITNDDIKKEIVDLTMPTSGGSWQFGKDVKLNLLDTKFTAYENILFIEFFDDREMILADAKFSGNENLDKKVKIMCKGVLKTIWVWIDNKPLCTNISLVEFKSAVNKK